MISLQDVVATVRRDRILEAVQVLVRAGKLVTDVPLHYYRFLTKITLLGL